MMRLNTPILLPALLLILLTAGCVQPIRSTETPLPTSMVTHTATTILTLTPTHTMVPTNASTTIPTLLVEQAHARLLELLADNGNCRLPCLWGITPGKSTYQEAQAILEPLSGISVLTDFRTEGGSIRPWYTEGNLILSTTVGFNVSSLSDNQIVSRIGFHAEEFKELPDNRIPIYDSTTFGERLRPYMLPGILSEFGKPASVVMQTYGQQIRGYGGFEIILLYPDQGMLVHYTMQMESMAANARGCPTNAQVELELYPSGDKDAFAKSLSATDWGVFAQMEPVDNPYWKSIDKATSMTLEQFYETFRQPSEKCIETPLKGWYMPEQ